MGIDVSKAKLDFALLDGRGHVVDQAEVPNTGKGINLLLGRWGREAGMDRSACLACFEPTGHYSNTLLAILVEGGVPAWAAHPMDIRQSMGMVRGKNDRIDAVRIADFAMRHRDKQRKASSTTVAMLELKQLLAFRDRLVADGAKLGFSQGHTKWTLREPPTHKRPPLAERPFDIGKQDGYLLTTTRFV
ncbi:MAG: IS110 family transposase [Flavobacteriales bacterium]|nr:IS110 family transposase [Flavobacteriales bacterium]HRO40920.1 transposase [Flavobacteriales bacterium]HRP82445.1 transposase [Flavobacteriales bacterium]